MLKRELLKPVLNEDEEGVPKAGVEVGVANGLGLVVWGVENGLGLVDWGVANGLGLG